MSSVPFHLLQHVIDTHSLLSAHEHVFIATKCFNGIITATMITHTINSKYTGCANSEQCFSHDADRTSTYENGATYTHINNRKAGEKKGVMYRFMFFFSFPYTAEDMVSTCSCEQHKQQHFVDLKFSHRYRAMSIMYKQLELHKPYIHFFLLLVVERLEYTSLGNRRVKNSILINIKKNPMPEKHQIHGIRNNLPNIRTIFCFDSCSSVDSVQLSPFQLPAFMY